MTIIDKLCNELLINILLFIPYSEYYHIIVNKKIKDQFKNIIQIINPFYYYKINNKYYNTVYENTNFNHILSIIDNNIYYVSSVITDIIGVVTLHIDKLNIIDMTNEHVYTIDNDHWLYHYKMDDTKVIFISTTTVIKFNILSLEIVKIGKIDYTKMSFFNADKLSFLIEGQRVIDLKTSNILYDTDIANCIGILRYNMYDSLISCKCGSELKIFDTQEYKLKVSIHNANFESDYINVLSYNNEIYYVVNVVHMNKLVTQHYIYDCNNKLILEWNIKSSLIKKQYSPISLKIYKLENGIYLFMYTGKNIQIYININLINKTKKILCQHEIIEGLFVKLFIFTRFVVIFFSCTYIVLDIKNWLVVSVHRATINKVHLQLENNGYSFYCQNSSDLTCMHKLSLKN